MAINCVQILDEQGVNLWDVAEYLLLSEESIAGKQDDTWELRWMRLRQRGGSACVNAIYKNKLEDKINSDLILQYITDKEG